MLVTSRQSAVVERQVVYFPLLEPWQWLVWITQIQCFDNLELKGEAVLAKVRREKRKECKMRQRSLWCRSSSSGASAWILPLVSTDKIVVNSKWIALLACIGAVNHLYQMSWLVFNIYCSRWSLGWKFSVTPPHAVLVNGPRCDSGTHCSFSGRSRRRRDRRGCSGVCGPNVAINDILTTRKVTTCLHSLNSLQKRSIVKKIINEGPWLMTFSLTWCF